MRSVCQFDQEWCQVPLECRAMWWLVAHRSPYVGKRHAQRVWLQIASVSHCPPCVYVVGCNLCSITAVIRILLCERASVCVCVFCEGRLLRSVTRTIRPIAYFIPFRLHCALSFLLWCVLAHRVSGGSLC